MFANEPAYFFYAENRIYVNSTITVDRTCHLTDGFTACGKHGCAEKLHSCSIFCTLVPFFLVPASFSRQSHLPWRTFGSIGFENLHNLWVKRHTHVSFYRWSCRFVRPWFCRGLSVRERRPAAFLRFRPACRPDEEAWFRRKISPEVEMVTSGVGPFCALHNRAHLDIFDRLIGLDFSKRVIVRIP
jgi:hypothetical protein